MNRIFNIILIAAVFILISTSANAAKISTINFDDIPNNSDGWGFISDGYGGLNWENMGWVNQNYWGLYKAKTGINSAYNDNGLPASISALTGSYFNFDSAYLRSIYNNNTILNLIAYRNGNEVENTKIELSTNYTKYDFNYKNIDKITFITNTRDVNIDNISASPAPEASSILLGIMGLGGLFGIKTRKQ